MIAKGRMASNNEQVARHGFFSNDRRIHQGINFFQSTANSIVDNDQDSEETSTASMAINGKWYKLMKLKSTLKIQTPFVDIMFDINMLLAGNIHSVQAQEITGDATEVDVQIDF